MYLQECWRAGCTGRPPSPTPPPPSSMSISCIAPYTMWLCADVCGGADGGSHAWSCISDRPTRTLPLTQLCSRCTPGSVIERLRRRGVDPRHTRTKTPSVLSALLPPSPLAVSKFPQSLPSCQMWLPIRTQSCSANLHQTPSSCQILLHMLRTDNKAFQSSRGCRDRGAPWHDPVRSRVAR